MSGLSTDKKSLAFFFAVLIIQVFCTGCDTIDAVNPVVQAGKMQQAAEQTTKEVTQIKEYALQMHKKEIEQIENN